MTADGSSGDLTIAELLRRWDELTRCHSIDVADVVRFEMAAGPCERLAAATGIAVSGLRPGNAEAVAMGPGSRIGHDRRVASCMALRP